MITTLSLSAAPVTSFTWPDSTDFLVRDPTPFLYIVRPTGGTRIFLTERKMFPGFFDENFQNYGTVPKDPSPSTGLIAGMIYRQTRTGKFRNILAPFKKDPLRLMWPNQDAILEGIESKNTRGFFREGRAFFFPFSEKGIDFVTVVGRKNTKLCAAIHYAQDEGFWEVDREGNPENFFVFPQLLQH